MDITRGSAKIPWIPFCLPTYLVPHHVALGGLLAGPCGYAACLLREPEVLWADILPGTSLGRPPPGKPMRPSFLAWSFTNPEVPFIPQRGLVGSAPLLGFSHSLSSMSNSLPLPKKSDLNQVLTWNPPLGNPTKAHANPHWGQVLCEAEYGVDKCD